MDLRLWFYQCMSDTDAPEFPGKWRFKRLAKHLVNGHYYKVPYLSGAIWVCPVHAMGRQVFAGQIYEPVLVNVIQHFIRARFSFIDIGANIGLHTVAAGLEKVSENQFFVAFEPESINFSLLSKNCQANNLTFVVCQQEALGDKDGFLPLHISTTLNKGNHSLLARDGTVRGGSVKVSTLDRFFADSLSFTPVTPVLIKLDVEGFEWPVLQGGKQFLKVVNDAALICEITPKTLRTFGRSVDDLQDQLRAVGFTTRAILIDAETFDDAGEKVSDFCNMIFTKGALSESLLESLPNRSLCDLAAL